MSAEHPASERLRVFIVENNDDTRITLSQLLRVSPADGDALNFAAPIVEGFVMGDKLSWDISVERVIGLSFEIVEAR